MTQRVRMTRKSELINSFEKSLIQSIDSYLTKPRGDSSSQSRLLAFCFKNDFKFHAIIIAQGLLKCNQFDSIYLIWEKLQGKRFYEKQNAEAYFISKCLKPHSKRIN